MAIPTAKLKDISFSSQFRYQRVFSKGHSDFSLGTNPVYNVTTVTIPHNLGYKPFFRLFIQFPGSIRLYQMETGTQTFGLVGVHQVEGIGSDGTNIYVQFGSYGPSAGIGKVYYRIYEEVQA